MGSVFRCTLRFLEQLVGAAFRIHVHIHRQDADELRSLTVLYYLHSIDKMTAQVRFQVVGLFPRQSCYGPVIAGS